MRGFATLDNPAHEGKTNTWLTPLNFVRSLGEFDLDPCAFPGHETAKRLISLPEDGLAAQWNGRVWLNPPYGKAISHWLKKLEEHGNGIALVFSRTDTKWFQSLRPDMIFAVRGRIAFLREDLTSDSNAGHGSVLLAWGRKNCGAILQSEIEGIWYK